MSEKTTSDTKLTSEETKLTSEETKPTSEETKPTSEETKTKPKGKLTLTNLILMGLANIVGAGIFVIISKSIKYGGKKSLMVLLTVASISLIMGFCYLEIYSRYKSSITEYLAVQNTLGENAGQITLYLIYFFAVFTAVTIVISVSKYLSSIGILSKFRDSSLFQKCVSIFLLCFMSYINYVGIKTSTIVSNSISILMLIILGSIILLSLKFITVDKSLKGPTVPWNSFVLSAVLSLFLFNGYDFLIKISDESADPNNNKIALIASISITTLIYISIIISAVCVLGYKTASNTSNIITNMYEVLTKPSIAYIVYIIGAFIMFNTAFLSALSATKFMQGLGKENKIAFSNFWSKSNQHKSPSNAIVATLAISIVLAIINNEVLMTIFTNMSCIMILALISIALLMIRWSERNNIDAQHTHNYIKGNINNIPIIVIINLCVLFYVFYLMIKNKFWIGKV
jgi:APA family basic amino acid/polyamine antiporter